MVDSGFIKKLRIYANVYSSHSLFAVWYLLNFFAWRSNINVALLVYFSRIEKQRLELERLEAERERILLERERQRRERERLEQEREEERRIEMMRSVSAAINQTIRDWYSYFDFRPFGKIL